MCIFTISIKIGQILQLSFKNIRFYVISHRWIEIMLVNRIILGVAGWTTIAHSSKCVLPLCYRGRQHLVQNFWFWILIWETLLINFTMFQSSNSIYILWICFIYVIFIIVWNWCVLLTKQRWYKDFLILHIWIKMLFWWFLYIWIPFDLKIHDQLSEF